MADLSERLRALYTGVVYDTLSDLGMNIEPGFSVLAIRRGGRYVYRPRGGVRLAAGDELIASGPDEGRPLLARMCGWDLVEDEDGDDELVPAGTGSASA